jgi:hypothetical protein
MPTVRQLDFFLLTKGQRVGRSRQTKGIIAGFILQQIFAIEGAILLRPDETARKRCPDDRELRFAIEFASDFCNTQWPDSIGFWLVAKLTVSASSTVGAVGGHARRKPPVGWP